MKLLDRVERAIDRRKAHIRDVVDSVEPFQRELSDLVGVDLFDVESTQRGLDVDYERLQALAGNVSLTTRTYEAAEELGPVKHFGGTLMFTHPEHRLLYPLVRCEAEFTVQALAASPHRIAVVGDSRLQHP